MSLLKKLDPAGERSSPKCKCTSNEIKLVTRNNEDSVFIPVKSNAVGLKDSFVDSIRCKSDTKSEGIDEKVSLVK